jgi:membrane protein YdbS with pleckstrin-like domain
MATLTYHCPHCGATHEVDEALVGDRIDCRKCGRPFEAAMPVARPDGGESTSKPEFRVAAGQGEVEDTILEVHPAMFRKHPGRWIVLAIVLALGVIGMIFGAMGKTILPWKAPPALLLWTSAAITGVAAVYALLWWVQTRFTTLKITNRRTTLRRGLLARDTSEVRHRDVRNLQVNQTTLERLLGVGDIAISSAGQDDLEINVKGVPDPQKIASIVRDMQE